ncbi:MAG: hypothetical protein CL811_01245 [Colwelliaceae bacterium]|nr:hypothetical protein [Colwelliaceae bacterium]|tara:strand:+ start:502 stop:972 length:471 start_codon:yes stop_codon:yes gene_type:complete
MISNTSPLIFLAKIGKIKILKELFKEITIPKSVKEELLEKNKLDSKIIVKTLEEDWIKITNPKDEIELNLGKGENSAISLAKELDDRLIIDDSQAIRAANALGIKTYRTTSIILLALKNNKISKEEAIDSINSIIREGYYIAPRYYSQLLTKLNNF